MKNNNNEVKKEKGGVETEQGKFGSINRKKPLNTASVRKVVGGKATKLMEAQHNEILVSI